MQPQQTQKQRRLWYQTCNLWTVVMLFLVLIMPAIVPADHAFVSAQDDVCAGDGIYLYEHSDFKGRCKKFTSNHNDLRNIGFDNIVSSIRFVGEYAPWQYRVLLCEHPNYQGTCSPFFIGDDNSLGNNHIKHDRSSSIGIEYINFSDSVRIGTYNIQAFPSAGPVGWVLPDGCCEDIPDRPRKIAERIINSQYDIIAFNEAFNEGMRDELIDRLKEYYPHYVAKIDAGGTDEDSGLMLFSRFPFVQSARTFHWCTDWKPGELTCSITAYNGTQGDWSDVSFIDYSDFHDHGCNGSFGEDGSDCNANKGVAYVRIQNPYSRQIYNVVFTHMDAGSTLGDVHAREHNLAAVQRLLQEVMTAEQRATEDIFVMGDLNIDGDPRKARTEWKKYFATPGSFFTDHLQDVWEYQIQPNLAPELQPYRDLGLTSDVPEPYDSPTRARLDYILHNNPTLPTFNNELCVQHMTIDYNLRHGDPYVEGVLAGVGVQDLSDHYGVHVDINKKTPYCNPSSARNNPPLDTWLQSSIKHPGIVQWYRFDPAVDENQQYYNGTFSIGIRGDRSLDFQVFRSSNLSAPLPREAEQIPGTGWTYHVTNEPFYVRVFSNRRDVAGNAGTYEIIFHKHRGANVDDAILLHPSEPFGIYFEPNETKWFLALVDGPENNSAQNLTFSASRFAQLELRAEDTTTVLVPKTDRSITRSNSVDNFTRRYLLVTNTASSRDYKTISWTTNLTILHGTLEQPLHLRAEVPTEGGLGEDDDIQTLKIRADGILAVDTRSLGDFDDKQMRGLGDVIDAVGFLEGLELELIEHDVLNPNHHMIGSRGPLDVEQVRAYPRIDLRHPLGHYTLDVTLSHSVPIAIRRTQPFMPIFRSFLPFIIYEQRSESDLVGNFSLSPNKQTFNAGEPVEITAVVTNQGTAVSGPFWVDLFINPDPIPTAANTIWSNVCSMDPCFGIAWEVSEGLAPGESITLTSTPESFSQGHTIWPGWFAHGTRDLYLYVDSYNLASPKGAVVESNETNNRAERRGLTVTGVNPAQVQGMEASELPPRPAPTGE